MKVNINNYLSLMDDKEVDGLIMTMWADDPKWSFVGFNNDGQVNNVVEKEVISNEATVGIYNFQRGSDFVKAADQMIVKNLRVKNEFYVAPVYNEMINDQAKIKVFNVGKEFDGMYGLGIPTDLEKFISNKISSKV